MLINCVVYENGAKLADIPVSEISDWLARPGCFVWVALQDATPDELDEMQREFALHELAVEDARHGHQRPKIEEYGDSLFVVMHLIEPEPEGGGLSVGEVDVFAGRNYVLSVRSRRSSITTRISLANSSADSCRLAIRSDSSRITSGSREVWICWK